MLEKEYIDLEEAVATLKHNSLKCFNSYYKGYVNAIKDLADIPPADVVPIRHGHWVNTTTEEEKNEMSIYTCSICGNNLVLDIGLTPKDECVYYCSYCGAKMGGKEE